MWKSCDLGTDDVRMKTTTISNLNTLSGGRLNCMVFLANVSDGNKKPLTVGSEIMDVDSSFVLLFLGFFAGVGLASMRVKQDTTDDYLVAGRGMHLPGSTFGCKYLEFWHMFIGFIGFIYLMGYSAIWTVSYPQSVNWLHGFGCTNSSKKKETNVAFVLFPP